MVLRETKPAEPLAFDTDKCIGCNRCLEACQIDIMIPSEEKGSPPLVAFPDECWYCGACVMECPTGAISLQHPLMNQVRWAEKSSLTARSEA
ncbi:MAG: ferredoxin family protein [Firmicutes bacterium]|nr:ferredoxin family protein [Candidatus Fermentithermobacillaceae bacterium]